MKRLILLLLILGIAMSLFAQTIPRGQFQFAAGNWGWSGNRLVQNDANAWLAKTNVVSLPQSGVMNYQFNMRHEGGIEDGHGGVGIHVFMDTALNAESWGAGNSYLLWLNYDENPVANSGIPRGLSAQIYKSVNNSQMDLLDSVSLDVYTNELIRSGILNHNIPVNIMINGSTGEVRIYSPIDQSFFFYYYLPARDLPLRGNNVALRTNGMKVSFGEGLQ